MRIVLIEKYKPNYIDEYGTSVWTNKYGDIIRRVDKEGRLVRQPGITWSAEAIQDLMAYQGLDVVAELERALADELSREIDKTILNDMIHLGTNYNFDGETNTLNVNMRFMTETILPPKIIDTIMVRHF